MRLRLGPAREAIGAVALAMGLTVIGCDEGPGWPSGRVMVSVGSPTGDDGAALVEIAGGAGRVQGPDGAVTLTYARNDTLWVFIAREEPGRIAFAIELDRRADVAFRLLQVADGDDRLQALDGYTVEVAR